MALSPSFNFGTTSGKGSSTQESGTRPNPEFFAWMQQTFPYLTTWGAPQIQQSPSVFGYQQPGFWINSSGPYGTGQAPGTGTQTGGVGTQAPGTNQTPSFAGDMYVYNPTTKQYVPYTPQQAQSGQPIPNPNQPQGGQQTTQPTGQTAGPRKFRLLDLFALYPRDKQGDLYRVLDKGGLDPNGSYTIEEWNAAFNKGGDWSGTSKGYWTDAIQRMQAQGSLLDAGAQRTEGFTPIGAPSSSWFSPQQLYQNIMKPIDTSALNPANLPKVNAPTVTAQQAQSPWITPPRVMATPINYQAGGNLFNSLFEQQYLPVKQKTDTQRALDREKLLSDLAQRGLEGSGVGFGMEERVINLPYREQEQENLRNAANATTVAYNQFEYQRALDQAKMDREAGLANAGFDAQARSETAKNILTSNITNLQAAMQAAIQSGDWQMQAQIANIQNFMTAQRSTFDIWLQEKNQILAVLEQAGVDINRLNNVQMQQLSLVLQDRAQYRSDLLNAGQYGYSRASNSSSGMNFGIGI